MVYAKEVDFSRAPNLFGLFANRRAALQALQSIADEQKLCYGLLGLEPLSRGRACFRSALKRCAGACCGKESHEDSALRLRQSLERLRVVCWPWQGGGAERTAPGNDSISYYSKLAWLGAVNSLEDATTLIRTPAGFDHDGYKIFVSRCFPVTMKLLNLIRRMTSEPVDFTEQQFTFAVVKPQGVPAIEPARALVGSEQFIAQLPRPVNHKHHPAA